MTDEEKKRIWTESILTGKKLPPKKDNIDCLKNLFGMK